MRHGMIDGNALRPISSTIPVNILFCNSVVFLKYSGPYCSMFPDGRDDVPFILSVQRSRNMRDVKFAI